MSKHRCFAVDLGDGATMRVHGNPNMAPEALDALKEIGRAAAAKLRRGKVYEVRDGDGDAGRGPSQSGAVMSRETDPLRQALTVLETDYSDYGGRVVRWCDPGESDEDCSCGCRWARYLEGSGDWLVCAKPGAPRFGMLTWEHQAGRGCFEWACYQCGETACQCVDGEVSCEACQATKSEAEAKHASSKWHHLTRHRGTELVRDLWLCERCNDHVVKISVERPEVQDVARQLIRWERHGTTEKAGDEA